MNMLKVKICTYVLVANLSFAVRLELTFGQFIGHTWLVIHYPSLASKQ